MDSVISAIRRQRSARSPSHSVSTPYLQTSRVGLSRCHLLLVGLPIDEEEVNSIKRPRRCDPNEHRVIGDMNMRKMRGGVRLSGLQRAILLRLDAKALWIMLHGSAEDKAALAAWGIPWHPGVGDLPWSSARRASYSRALARLEERSSVVRRNRRGSPVRRTTHVQLSLRGKIAVQRLTAQARRDVNRTFRQIELRRRALVRRRRRKPSFQ